ncbi:MAG: hypothetical protein AB7G10_28420 [Reyranellaceae bacterium]
MTPPHFQGRREAEGSGVASKILRFSRQPVNDTGITNCATCGGHFRPQRVTHRYCGRCYSYHALAMALAAFRHEEAV